MSAELKLLPCPWCGEVPTSFGSTDGSGKWGWVECCISGPDVRTGYKPLAEWKDDAIAAWNTRAAPAQATDVPEADFGNRAAQATDEVSNSVVRNFRSTDAPDLMTDAEIVEVYRATFNAQPDRMREAPKGVPPLVIEFARALLKQSKPIIYQD